MNKNSERHVVERFLSQKNLGLRVHRITNNETPDFIVETPSKKISIEITTLFNPGLKQKESFQNLLIQKAANIFEKKYDDRLNVFITFSEGAIKCSKAKIDIYANEVFELIEKIYLNNKKYEFTISSWRNYVPINDYIKKFYIDNSDNFTNWQSFGAFVVDEIDFDFLKKSIISKEKNIPKYKDTFDKNWLVLVANFGTKSSAHDFRFVKYDKVTSEFDRIFVYKYFENKIIKLK